MRPTRGFPRPVRCSAVYLAAIFANLVRAQSVSEPTADALTGLDATMQSLGLKRKSYDWVVDPNLKYTDGISFPFKLTFRWNPSIRVCFTTMSWAVGFGESSASSAACNRYQPHYWDLGTSATYTTVNAAIQQPESFECNLGNTPPEFGYALPGAINARIPLCTAGQIGRDSWTFSLLSEQYFAFAGCITQYVGAGTGVMPMPGTGSMECRNNLALDTQGSGYATHVMIAGSLYSTAAGSCASSSDCILFSGLSDAQSGGSRSLKFHSLNKKTIKKDDTALIDIVVRWNSNRRMFCNEYAGVCYSRVWFEASDGIFNAFNLSYPVGSAPPQVIGSGTPMTGALSSLMLGLIVAASDDFVRTQESILAARLEAMAGTFYTIGRVNYESLTGDPLIMCDAKAEKDFSYVISAGVFRVNVTGKEGGNVTCNYTTDEMRSETGAYGDLFLLGWIGNTDAKWNETSVFNKFSLTLTALANLANGKLVLPFTIVAAITIALGGAAMIYFWTRRRADGSKKDIGDVATEAIGYILTVIVFVSTLPSVVDQVNVSMKLL